MFQILHQGRRIELLDPSAPNSAQGEIAMERKSTKTTIPFIKNNEFDYAWLVSFINEDHRQTMDMACICNNCDIYCNFSFKWSKSY